MVDPITGGFLGWVCGKLGDGVLNYLVSNDELGKQLDKAIGDWAKGLPPDRRLVPAALYEGLGRTTPEERPHFCAVQEWLKRKDLPPQEMWRELFLESWRWVRANVEEPQAFFRLEEADACEELERLAQTTYDVCVAHKPIFNKAVVSKLDGIDGKIDGLDEHLRQTLRSETAAKSKATWRPPFDRVPRAKAGTLFGRDVQLDDLSGRLERREDTCVWGPAGFGKTALAGEAIMRVVGDDEKALADSPFPDGVVLLDLYRLKANADRVWHELADRFAPDLPADLPAKERATRACARRRALVVVEGAEEAGDGRTLQTLLSVLDGAGTRLVLTRNKAQVFCVHPIQLGDELAPDDALALLARLTEGDVGDDVLESVVAQFGGHPLALTWAGCQLALGVERPERFLKEMRESGLPGLHEPGYEDHTIKWLYDRSVRGLSDDARRVLGVAALLNSAPFPLGAAVAGLGDERPDLAAASALRELVWHGLLRLSDTDDERWEFTHALASRFAQAETSDGSLALEALCLWAVAALQDGCAQARDVGSFLRVQYALRHATALLALDRSADAGPRLANWLLYDAQDLFFALGRLSAAREALDAVEAWMRHWSDAVRAEPEKQREFSVLLNRKGDVQLAQGDLSEARSSYEEDLKIAKALSAGDPSHTGWRRDLSVSLNKLGDVQLAQDDLPGARSSYEESLKIAKALSAGDRSHTGWRRDVVVSHCKLGKVAVREGDKPVAKREFQAGLAIAEKLCELDATNVEWQNDVAWLRARLDSLGA